MNSRRNPTLADVTDRLTAALRVAGTLAAILLIEVLPQLRFKKIREIQNRLTLLLSFWVPLAMPFDSPQWLRSALVPLLILAFLLFLMSRCELAYR